MLQTKADLDALPPEWPENPLPAIRTEIARSGRKFVVLDDDPTGPQTAHSVPVITGWSVDELAAELRDPGPVVYVLTNSRSLPEPEAVALARDAAGNLAAASQQTGRPVVLGMRGDSTLRGHYPAELWAARDALAARLGLTFDGELLVPFFLEGGRFTVGDVHYVLEGERLVPAGETEFARDPAFGYRSSHLPSWVEEKTGGRVKAADVVSIALETLRQGGPEAVARQLLAQARGRVVCANAASYRDLEVLVLGLLRAEAAGLRLVYRTAASFVRVRAGLGGRPLLAPSELYGPSPGPAGGVQVPQAAPGPLGGPVPNATGVALGCPGGLIVVGSYVRRTSEQLAAAVQLPGLEAREYVVGERGPQAAPGPLGVPERAPADQAAELAAWIDATIARGRDALIYTSRSAPTGASPEASLRASQAVSAGLVEVVRRVTQRPRFIVAKGGITASDLATRALGVKRAVVPGQIAPGVPVWLLGPESRFPGTPYVIFPGNVGTPRTLVEVIERLRP